MSIFSRIEVTFIPLPTSLESISGESWRSLAAVALDETSKHQLVPSIGPACTDARSASGIND
jgi:hypothetical protein